VKQVDRGLAAVVLVAFAAYAALSVVRHETFRSSGFDLALFEQVVRHYSNLEAPASAIRGVGSIYRDHVSPVLVVLAPLYALWSSAVALLVAQAAAVAASALPLFAYARRRIGRSPALMLTAAYLLFGGVQEGVWSDFHEVAFAPLLIGGAILLADRGRWRASLAVALALLLVKEDLAFLVAAIGLWYATQGHPRLALAAVASGLGWYVLVTEVLVPHYGYVDGYHLANLTAVAWPKVRTTAYLFGAFLGVSLLSPLALLSLPLVAERMLSSHSSYWTLPNHYSLTIAPVLALAAADGLGRLGPRRAARIAAATLGVAIALTPALPLWWLTRPSFYSTPRPYRSARAALATIPARVSVAASNHLAPHLGGRPGLTVLGPQPTEARYVIAAIDDGSAAGAFPLASATALSTAVATERRRRPVVFARGGIVVLGPIRA
jgi:uncharacterized membrane protein